MILHYSNFKIPEISAILTPVAGTEATLLAQAAGQAPLQPSCDDSTGVARHEVTAEQVETARQVFAAGGSIGEAARASGMAWSTARIWLKDDVDASGRDLVTWHQLTDAELAEAAKLRDEGWTFSALGQRYGVTRVTMAKRLKGYSPGSR